MEKNRIEQLTLEIRERCIIPNDPEKSLHGTVHSEIRECKI